MGQHRAFLVVIRNHKQPRGYLEESFDEMKELIESAAAEVCDHARATIDHPDSHAFVRGGKLAEIAAGIKVCKANVVIFNVDLTPAQARNIEKVCRVRVVDRTGLILDIFGRRAKSSAGKLQVELARLNYLLPRLGGLGRVMSRLGGGVGTRGPGEQELEWDRRKIRRRIERVKEDLKKVRKHRELLRAGRQRKRYTSVALVGYTNAGKSTLLNALTGADSYVRDKLFATLDPKTRKLNLAGRHDVLFTDTVGFLRDLPHSLVESFQATLEEVSEADILIHVLDVSSPHVLRQKEVVEAVLEEIGASKKTVVLALNKAELLSPETRQRYGDLWPDGIFISASLGQGLQGLLARLESRLRPGPSLGS